MAQIGALRSLGCSPAAKHLKHFFGHARATAKRADNQRQIKIVHIEPPRRQPILPSAVERLAERVAELSFKNRRNGTPHDMVYQRKTRRRDRQQHRVTRIFPRFERNRINRFERQAFEPDHLQRQSVTRQYRVFIDLRSIRKMVPRCRFPTCKFVTGGTHWPPTDDDF